MKKTAQQRTMPDFYNSTQQSKAPPATKPAANDQRPRQVAAPNSGKTEVNQQQHGTGQATDAPTAQELSTLLPFAYNEVNFDNITNFLTQFSRFTPAVGREASNIVNEINFARVLMRQPGPIIMIGDVTSFLNVANDPKNAAPMIEHLNKIIGDTAALYSQCIYRLENKQDIKTRQMRQNLEVATANMNTFVRFKYAALRQASK
jgi:hypothetical protein